MNFRTLKWLRHQKVFVYFSSKYFLYFWSVRREGQTFVCSLFWSDGGRRKYYKSRVGRYSHQVPIICLSAIKIPANVLSSDQVVQPWQILGWTWTEHSSSGSQHCSFFLISYYFTFLAGRWGQVWDGLYLPNISSLALQVSTENICYNYPWSNQQIINQTRLFISLTACVICLSDMSLDILIFQAIKV